MALRKLNADPFTTRVGKLVANATVGTQTSLSPSLATMVCDAINSNEQAPWEALRALKKRVSRNRNHREIRLSLALVERTVRCCGHVYRSLLMRREFVRDVLAKLLKPKYHRPPDVQDHLLRLIQTWATTDQGRVDVTDVRDLYVDLIRKGATFPTPGAHTPGAHTPGAHTPGAHTPGAHPPGAHPPGAHPPAAYTPGAHTPGARTPGAHTPGACTPGAHTPGADSGVGPTSGSRPAVARGGASAPLHPPSWDSSNLAPEQVAKLHSELDLVHMNLAVISAILLENVPGYEDPNDMRLLQQLHVTCSAMQQRIVELLPQVEQTELRGSLLTANVQLQRAALRMHRFQRSRDRILGRGERVSDLPEVLPENPCAPSSFTDLINFSSTDPCPSPLVPLCVGQLASLDLESDSMTGRERVASPDQQIWTLDEAALTDPTSTLPPRCSPTLTTPAPEPLYTNVCHRGCSVTRNSHGHTAGSQPETSKAIGPQLVGLEFDPLANDNGRTEAIYEDLDLVLLKAQTLRGSD